MQTIQNILQLFTFFVHVQSMGRKKLYHTSEEKAIANRVKSKKYYDRYFTIHR